MKCLRLSLTLLVTVVLAGAYASAQSVPSNCIDNTPDAHDPTPPCNLVLLNGLGSGAFHAAPFLDTLPDGNGHWPRYGDPDNNIQSLYADYGNNESTSTNAAAVTHYTLGKNLASQIVPLCPDGTTNCADTSKAIVFLFIGFSNTDIEIGGGNADVWDKTDDSLNEDPANHLNGHLFGQPCSTLCENLNNPDGATAFNQVTIPSPTGDGYIQKSLLNQVYPDTNPLHWLVGPHVVVFNGALGQQTLAKWDPTPVGYYSQWANCAFDHQNAASPECNYVRVKDDLTRNGYTEAQVQAVFIKSGDNFPHCDLKHAYWDGTCTQQPPPGVLSTIDAYQAEQYLGDILRYLKCCKLGPNGNPSSNPRYPSLKQVFVTSRIYGGWANGNPNGCLNPEPLAYEEGFAVQRAIVAQINQDANITNSDSYSGQLDYQSNGTGHAPWFDWAPYLWADGVNPANLRSDGLVWCDWTTRTNQYCAPSKDQGDVRFGDIDPNFTQYYGDQTHPTGWGTAKVANQLLEWIQNNLPTSQQYLSDWFGYTTTTPWIKQ